MTEDREGELLNRIVELEAALRRAIAKVDALLPWVMWDGLDGDSEQAEAEETQVFLRAALTRKGAA